MVWPRTETNAWRHVCLFKRPQTTFNGNSPFVDILCLPTISASKVKWVWFYHWLGLLWPSCVSSSPNTFLQNAIHTTESASGLNAAAAEFKPRTSFGSSPLSTSTSRRTAAPPPQPKHRGPIIPVFVQTGPLTHWPDLTCRVNGRVTSTSISAWVSGVSSFKWLVPNPVIPRELLALHTNYIVAL